jgi:hypothetical protein
LSEEAGGGVGREPTRSIVTIPKVTATSSRSKPEWVDRHPWDRAADLGLDLVGRPGRGLRPVTLPSSEGATLMATVPG